jgi:hypothetical protein
VNVYEALNKRRAKVKTENAPKSSTVIFRVFPIAFCALIFCFVETISTVYAQGQPPTFTPDKIRTLLLRPGGWEGDSCGPGGCWDLIIRFEASGEKTLAKIKILDGTKVISSCQQEAVLSSDIVKFDGCRSSGIALQFDPNDNVYLFKGGVPHLGFKIKLKEK